VFQYDSPNIYSVYVELNFAKRNVMRDKLGILFSGACIAHCILVPVLLALVSSNVILGVLASEWVHIALLVPVFIMCLVSLPKAWLQTRSSWILFLAIFGVCLLISSRFTHGFGEVLFTVLGSTSLIIAHGFSLRLRAMVSYNSSLSSSLINE